MKGDYEMKFSYSAVWADAMELLRTHGSLIATIAGVFVFLPALLIAYLLPEPQPKDVARIWSEMAAYFRFNFHWFLLQSLVGMIGSISILLMIFRRDISVGGAIAAAVALLPFYFLASLAGGLIVTIGFILLVVPGLYLAGRLAPLGAVVVAENRRNPIEVVSRTFALTKAKGWAIIGFLIVVLIAVVIVFGVLGMLLGLLFLAVAGQDLGALLTLIVGAALDAAMVVLFVLLNAAIYRQLAGNDPQSVAAVFE